MSNVDHPSLDDANGLIMVVGTAVMPWRLGFNLGNCVKYISRAGKKHAPDQCPGDALLDDLRKALWYLNREVEAWERSRAKANAPQEPPK